MRPRVIALTTSALASFCSHCSGPPQHGALKRCTRCRAIWYCDAECQNKDWAYHKTECEALQRWATMAPSPELSVPSDAIRCLGRVLWDRQKKGPESEFVKEWNMLQSNKVALQTSALEAYTHLAHSVVRYVGATSPAELMPFGISSAGQLVDLISKFTTNTFTLTSPSLDPIGVCVAPTFALLNHSCDPNAVLVFPRCAEVKTQEPRMNLIAIRPIGVDEEIFISYVDTTLPGESRRSALQETYNFQCECAMCREPVHPDPRQSIWCPKACGGTCPVPSSEVDLVRCARCRAIVSSVDSVLDVVRIGQEALDKANTLQFRDPEKSIKLTSNMLPILISSGLTPSCHPLLALTRLHQELLMASFTPDLTQDILDKTIQASTNYSTGVSSILTYGHPVRAAALAELGKLLAVDEITPQDPSATDRYPPSGPKRLRLAYETLVRAREELLIGFGKVNQGGSIGKEVREAIVRLEKELGVWTQGIRNALHDQRLAGPSK
ncbi:SET domain-containing protein [Irpex rosettiformis]|uniref:SET domain-containing protein n=1 Tax=Irpex rosettiformis TaxID=378272 RepID=A0ACB8U3C1_9APHY|nr:SET domain-containing protein [Irpex rosettiformis]